MAALPVETSGYVVETHKARKLFFCSHCQTEIKPGEIYSSVTMGGGGLGWLKFPNRVHNSCLKEYLETLGGNDGKH